MTTARAKSRASRLPAPAAPTTRTRKSRRPRPYHHGSLRQALLAAAERILEREGVAGLTLRAAAREAGVSHAAPKNHFEDLTALLSELAAEGFRRFAEMMLREVPAKASQEARLAGIGHGYVAFARAHPGLFILMFRSDRLDMARPALRDAAQAAASVLFEAVAPRAPLEGPLTLPQAGAIVAAWSLTHGFAMLLLDGRLATIEARLPRGAGTDALLDAVFNASKG